MIKKKYERLQLDNLIPWLKSNFSSFTDVRGSNSSIKIEDSLLSGFAIFSLKDKSMLFFDNKCTQREENLKQVYKIEKVPSDSGMREILDKVKLTDFHRLFKGLVSKLRKARIWKNYEYYQGYMVCAIDGVHYFSSENIGCKCCSIFTKKKKIKGSKDLVEVKENRHYLLSGVIVHPDKKEVMPVIHEPILREDGTEKNDCEQNAGKRLLPRLKKQFPEEKIVIVEDSLGSNGPHIRAIQEEKFNYILGIKPKGNKYLFELMNRLETQEKVHFHEEIQEGKIHRYRYANKLPLNSSHRDIKVNFIEYREIDQASGEIKQHFSWITDFFLTKKNVYSIMRMGRSRWKIENETFNTLKNQGYNFKHNYGHGTENLSTVLALLMMLAFWVDQIQQGFNETFKKAWKKKQTKIALWEGVRSKFEDFPLESMHMVYLLIIGQLKVKVVFYQDSG